MGGSETSELSLLLSETSLAILLLSVLSLCVSLCVSLETTVSMCPCLQCCDGVVCACCGRRGVVGAVFELSMTVLLCDWSVMHHHFPLTRRQATQFPQLSLGSVVNRRICPFPSSIEDGLIDALLMCHNGQVDQCDMCQCVTVWAPSVSEM